MDVRDIEIGLDGIVISHLHAPKSLLAQVHLPLAGQCPLTRYLISRDNLIPTILRITENQRTGRLEGIVPAPKLTLFIFDGSRSQVGHLASQTAQHFTIGLADAQFSCV